MSRRRARGQEGSGYSGRGGRSGGQQALRAGGRQEGSRMDREEQQARRGNLQIIFLTYAVCIVFLGMVGYLVYFMVAKSQTVINNPYNKLYQVLEEKVHRGEIRSADGKVLAKTVTDEEGQDTRVYPYDEIFCHVVGRSTNSMTGIERDQCYPLLTSHVNPLAQLVNTFRGEKNPGDHVVTTLDTGLQQAAYNALGSYRGAVVALEPATGKILAMVSKPAYNPNYVSRDWEELTKDSGEESALLNRAAQGLYPPGSTFKILTAMEYLLEHPSDYEGFHYDCKGTDSFSGNVINCYGKTRHGSQDLTEAFAHSCNGAFAQIGTLLDQKAFRRLAEKFRFNKGLGVDFVYSKSRFALTQKADTGEVTQTAIGQGKTMITPLENALITAAVANGGVMMLPYMVERVENDMGQVVKEYEPESGGRMVKEWVAEEIGSMMRSVVKEGTASALNSLPYGVAGKTGSAEFDSEGSSHAWFVGYGPVKEPKLVVSIVVEGAGTGSQYAVPIAKRLFEEYDR